MALLIRFSQLLIPIGLIGLLAGGSSLAWAQGAEEETADDEASEKVQAPTPRQPMEAIVRGFYVEARIGGGYTVAQQNLEPTETFPGLSGSEGYGTAFMMQVGVGYDITDFLAFELIGGSTFLAGEHRGSIRVRDMALYYGGAAIRLTYGLSDRLHLLGAVGAGYGRADNGVEAPQDGLVVLGNVGLEYYVNVRHFSIGLVASAVAPLSPTRAVVGLTPQIKYTF